MVCDALNSWLNRQFIQRQEQEDNEQDKEESKEKDKKGLPPNKDGNSGSKLFDCDSLNCEKYRQGKSQSTPPFPQRVNCCVDITILKQKIENVRKLGLSMCSSRTLATPLTTSQQYSEMDQLGNIAERMVKLRLQCLNEDLNGLKESSKKKPEEIREASTVFKCWSMLVTQFALTLYKFGDLEDYQTHGFPQRKECEQACHSLQTCVDKKAEFEGCRLDICFESLEKECKKIPLGTVTSIIEWIDAFNRMSFLLEGPAYVKGLYDFGGDLLMHLWRLIDQINTKKVPRYSEILEEKLECVEKLKQQIRDKEKAYRMRWPVEECKRNLKQDREIREVETLKQQLKQELKAVEEFKKKIRDPAEEELKQELKAVEEFKKKIRDPAEEELKQESEAVQKLEEELKEKRATIQEANDVQELMQKLDERLSAYERKEESGSKLEEADAQELLALLQSTEKHVSRLVPAGPTRSNVRKDLSLLIAVIKTKITLDDIMTEGLMVSRRRVEDASFSDMWIGDDIGSWGQLDFAKVQMFCFTLILALAYSVTTAAMFFGVLPPYTEFPVIQPAIAGFLAISNGGYIYHKVTGGPSTNQQDASLAE